MRWHPLKQTNDRTNEVQGDCDGGTLKFAVTGSLVGSLSIFEAGIGCPEREPRVVLISLKAFAFRKQENGSNWMRRTIDINVPGKTSGEARFAVSSDIKVFLTRRKRKENRL